MRIVAISDTHNAHDRLSIPEGDLLIHAGDITGAGRLEKLRDFNFWLWRQPHPRKLVIAGNHDWCFKRQPRESRSILSGATYLQDAGIVIEGIKIWGSPWQPDILDWAFNVERGPELAAKWALIPEDTDILITHAPPYGHGDLTPNGDRVGCRDLLARVERVRPRFHIFGHIHEGVGVTRNEHTTFVNAAMLDGEYQPVNRAAILDWDEGVIQAPGLSGSRADR